MDLKPISRRPRPAARAYLVGISAGGAVLALLLLSSCAAQTDAEPTEGIESLFSTKDQQRELAACLDDLGWSVTFNEDTGAFLTEIPAGQEDAYQTATADCSEEVGIETGGELTEAQLISVYGWYSDIRDCLSGAGWDVPSKPSFQTFVDTYDSDVPWVPWEFVPIEENGDAMQACPVMQPPTSG